MALVTVELPELVMAGSPDDTTATGRNIIWLNGAFLTESVTRIPNDCVVTPLNLSVIEGQLNRTQR